MNEAVKHDVQAELAFAAQRQGIFFSTGVLTPETTPVFRFFDSQNGTHFFTGQIGEATTLLQTRPDFVYEEANFRAFLPPASTKAPDAAALPVYRFFDTRQGTHFYTASEAERAQVQSTRSDLSFEGASFYEHVTPRSGDAAVYRFFDSTLGTHLYTADASERASILSTRADLKDEGIAFYSPTK